MAWFPSFRSYMDCSRPTDEVWATQWVFTRRQACWRKVISDGDITHFMGEIVIMVSICAHVPMSPRARTSVPDDRSGYKGTKKEWTRTIWDADWDCCVTSYLGLWFTGCLARHSVRVIQVDSSTRLLRERLASRLCVLCSLYLATSVVRGTAWLPQDFSAYCCQYYTKSVFTTSVVAAAVCGQVDSTHRWQWRG